MCGADHIRGNAIIEFQISDESAREKPKLEFRSSEPEDVSPLAHFSLVNQNKMSMIE